MDCVAMAYEIREITGHPRYKDRKGRVWACYENGQLFATASSKTQAKACLAKRKAL